MKKIALSFLALSLAACNGNKLESSFQAKATSDSIIGGKAVAWSDLAAKSTVSLMLDNGGEPASFCTGTVISADLIMTAFHCVEEFEESDIHVFLGTTLPTQMTDARLQEVEAIERHDKYEIVLTEDGNFKTAFNDIALIKLSKALPGATPVKILDPSSEPAAGAKLLLAGFGLINDVMGIPASGLNQVEVSMVRVMDGKILVTDQRNGSGACAGDSGGPAYLKSGNELVVLGITRGPHEAAQHCHAYGEYTYASIFKDFIIDGARKLGAQAPVFKALGLASVAK